MQMLSKPPHCQYVLQLVDWFEMDNCLLLVLERPIPCMDVYELCLSEGGTLTELLAKMIMLQVAIKHLRKGGSDLYITALVLKDVMKVKGQVSEVAALLLDPEPHIDNLGVNFFNELAAKDNAIYNLLPDIISRLSDPERGMKEEDFSTVMKTERQWADIAVSLSLLSMCERGFKKLQECWECYSDKLTEDAVYQPLLSILAKLRRRAEPQFKAQVEEFEKKLTAVHTKGLEDVENEEREQQLEKQKTLLCPRVLADQHEMDDSDLVTPKTSHARPKTVITFSSDEEEEEEGEMAVQSSSL
ncbi:hypothetical protein KOW79_007187 [Hemibagrus wyckioides]|uniref:Condensin complex subunit 1 C-terminal domain-containing protein n=1 Tax=Hemibagrus wyckioides TaxID=337641 RepID=A0A9D3SRQ5_9TELE|nr:hypothetical protein KOW79_007187 [Hemibagrus wyckioides]